METNGQEVLNFADLEVITIPVKYRGTEYVLHEADAATGVEYRRRILASAANRDAGVPEDGTYSGIPPWLVSRCLKHQAQDTHVTEEEVSTWPNRIVEELYEKARSISRLSREEAKN